MSFKLPTRRLVSQEDAAITPRGDVPRSRFLNAWTRKTAFDAGLLVPIMVEEILPGDHMTYEVTAYVRMSTPLFPLFDNQRIDTFFFFVPNRLVWENWTKFMGEQANPADSINFTVPVLDISQNETINSIYDHMGLPVDVGQLDPLGDIPINVLPLRAYNLIYNQWFRDENLINSAIERKGNTGDLVTDYAILRRAKSHDRFTSALPWVQKFTALNVPVAGQAPITGIGTTATSVSTGAGPFVETNNGSAVYAEYLRAWNGPPETIYVKAEDLGLTVRPLIYADLAQATGVAINTFRQAFLVQQLLERDARGGTRYTELVQSHFGVRNPDARLQRPEYIGGGSTPLTLTPIAQTAPTTGVPLGALGAAGTAAGTHRASYAATEHGFIIGLINVRSEISYQQGVHRMWSRQTRYDYPWPSLAGLGEQAILRKELYAKGDVALDDTVFGYEPRWEEYRTNYSEVTGMMRSYITGTLDAWHLAQRFTAAPTLGQAFIEDTPPMARVLAAGSLAVDQQYLADILYRRQAVRPITLHGEPVMLGRF